MQFIRDTPQGMLHCHRKYTAQDQRRRWAVCIKADLGHGGFVWLFDEGYELLIPFTVQRKRSKRYQFSNGTNKEYVTGWRAWDPWEGAKDIVDSWVTEVD